MISEDQRLDIIDALQYGADMRLKVVEACPDCAEDKACELHVADEEQARRWEKISECLRRPGD